MNDEKEITENYNPIDFFDRVKALIRENSDMPLREFLNHIGINPESYYTMRKLNNFPRCGDAQKIADELGVSLDYLVTGQVKDSGVFPYPPEFLAVCNGLLELDEDQREMVVVMMCSQIDFLKKRKSDK